MPDDTIRTMTNGVIDVAVSANTGRIVYFGFTNGANLLWIDPSAINAKQGEWQNWGGDKVWIWPQSEFEKRTGKGWPPPGDPPSSPFVITTEPGGGITMTGPIIPDYGVRLERTIVLQPGRPIMTVTNRFRVVDEAKATGIALWNVTQIPGVDQVVAKPIFPRLPSGEVRQTFSKPMSDSQPPWPLPQPSLADRSEVIFKRPTTGSPKVGFDADQLRVQLGDTFLTQRATFAPEHGKLDPSERAQLYTDNGSWKPGPYIELEFISPIWEAKDVKNGSLTITWALWKPKK